MNDTPDPPVAMSRRTLMKLGWGGTALLAAGGFGLALRPTVYREPRQRMKKLTTLEFSILAAVADRFHPGGDGLPSAWDLHVAERADEFLWRIHPADAGDLLRALRFLENAFAGAIFDGRTTTFTGSDPARQDAILERWRTSRFNTRREVFRGIRALTAAVYWGDPKAYQITGYSGPPDFGQMPSEGAP